MKQIKTISIIALLLFSCAQKGIQSDSKMTSIFNGSDFSGWILPDDNIWWSVSDGIMHLNSGPNKKGTILWTEKAYKDFVFKCEFKMGDGVIDSGIFLRSDHDQIQIGISGSLKRDMTCSPYIPGKGYPVEANDIAELLDKEGWNTLQVRAVGNKYTSWLNGREVMNYTSETATDMGPIGIQLHPKNEMSMQYRNIRVATL